MNYKSTRALKQVLGANGL